MIDQPQVVLRRILIDHDDSVSVTTGFQATVGLPRHDCRMPCQLKALQVDLQVPS